MNQPREGYALLSVLALLLLLSGLCAGLIQANLRQLRDNQHRAQALQERAHALHYMPAEN